MAVPYILIRQKSLPSSKWGGEEIVYARTVTNRKVGTMEVAHDVNQASTLSTADLMGAVYALIDAIAYQLMQGNAVKLEGLGTFRVVAGTPVLEHNKNPKASDFQRRRIAFRPDQELLKKCLSNLKFEPR